MPGDPGVVGRDEERPAAARERDELVRDRMGMRVVEVRGRLVEDEQRRIVQERAAQCHALPLAAGEALCPRVDDRAQTALLEELAGAPLVGSRDAVGHAGEERVPQRAQRVDQLKILEDEAHLSPPDLGAMRLTQTRRGLAVEMHLAARRREHRAHDREEGRLPAPARTAEDDDLAARDLERDVVHDRAPAHAVPHALHHVLDAHGGHRASCARLRQSFVECRGWHGPNERRYRKIRRFRKRHTECC